MTLAVQELLEQARRLSPEERRELCDRLGQGGETSCDAQTVDALDQALLADGLLLGLPPGMDAVEFRDWDPLPIQGKPLSETIIEERR